MAENNNAMVRVNTRISKKANDWLDNESKITGLPKSTLILLAIENYIQQKNAEGYIGDLNVLVKRLEELTAGK